VELTRAHLERIERLNPQINCYLTVSAELALEQARQAEDEIAQGLRRGPLHGIPLALKDLFETAGVRTTAGSSFFSDHIPAQDAFVVEMLKKAGAVLLGKTNMHEIALGITNENPHFGDCCNPWDVGRISGGSSGGSGAALAAGLCLGALGSDTGGSIRIPASLCGIVGLKPTYGRVSLRGAMPLSWNLDHAGPMARRVMDAALLLFAISEYDPLDPAAIRPPLRDYTSLPAEGLDGWRVALAADEFFTDPASVDSEVLAAVRQAAGVFAHLGASVEEPAFPGARQAALTNGLMVVSDAAALHKERLESQPERFGADVQARLQTGAAFSISEYIQARRAQVELRRQFESFFEHYDLLLTPTTPITAHIRGSADAVERARLLTRFTAPFNLTGLPALSVPCGFSQEGLPIGLQLVGRPWEDARLLRAAHLYEQAANWIQRLPSVGD
jgi:aspartyl-tRNA(Asn)/glutamyl-tRNA(Gln) amidotransferase subunit A